MKKKIAVFILLFYISNSYAQTNSENGFWLPVQDTIRVFLVFAEALNDSDYFQVTNVNWQPGQMPINPGKYFDAQFNSNNIQGYITRYFHEASYDKYIVIGDYYPNLIQVNFSQLKPQYLTYQNIIDTLHRNNSLDLITSTGLSINSVSDFDAWRNFGLGAPKINSTDTLVDLIMIIWRVNSRLSGGTNTNTGFAQNQFYIDTLKNKRGVNSYSEFVSWANDAEVIMRHEFSHLIFGGNNFHTAGAGAGTRTFISSIGGWSNMSSWDSNSQGWNAWDRWRLGWKNPSKQYLISGYNSQNNAETDFENYSLSNNPNGGEYVLQDFNSTGDAKRIKLPTVDNNALPQYLWLENHSISESEFDFNENRNNATDNLKAEACFQ